MPYVNIIKIKFYSSADLDLDSTLEFAQYLRFKYSWDFGLKKKKKIFMRLELFREKIISQLDKKRRYIIKKKIEILN